MHQVTQRIGNAFQRINPAPIVVLGNQKSGTSIITHLLADAMGKSKTVDIPACWPPNIVGLMDGSLRLADLAQQDKKHFAAAVIKEPNLTFLFPQVQQLHPQAQYVFIVRDPRDNIRSMLNRYKVPGNLSELTPEALEKFGTHNTLINPKVWGMTCTHYIDVLAERWRMAAAVYLQHQTQMHLLKYEDFLANKAATIASLIKELGMEMQHDIAGEVDVQYQPAGDKNISWIDFFGADNLQRINLVCEAPMHQLGYPA